MEQARLLARMAASNSRPIAALMLLAVIYVAGFWLPAPWYDPAMLTDDDYRRLARNMTLFAVGSYSWMIAIVLIEVLLIAVKRLSRSRLTTTDHADPFGRMTIVLSLVISFVMASNWIAQIGSKIGRAHV